LSRAENLNFFFGTLIFVEALSIAMLLWKWLYEANIQNTNKHR
jgi:hypothetical protein